MSEFNKRWLADAVRRNRTDTRDEVAEKHARSLTGDAEQRILAWAEFIAERDGLKDRLQAWRHSAGWALLGLLLLGLLSGFAAALAVLGDSSSPVNVIWALGSLLGINLLLLLVWLLSFSANTQAGSLGRLWYLMTVAFQKRLQKSGSAAAITQAFTTLTAKAGLSRWWLSVVSHLSWLSIMLGVLAGLMLALALRSYVFVWETTILPTSVFIGLVESLGVLPGMFGFATPSPDAIAISGAQTETIMAAQSDLQRRAWASWLTGCLLVYGILPRLLLSVVCWLRLTFGLRNIRLQTSSLAWVSLAGRLAPDSEKAGVTDPAPVSLPSFRRRTRPGRAGEASLLVGLEIASDLPWPPGGLADRVQTHLVDSRQQREYVLEQLGVDPPHKLLLACVAAQSPDRGALHWLAEAASQTSSVAVWLMGADRASVERLAIWRQCLLDLGISAQMIFDADDKALAWVGESS
ncbi:MAG: DUF2868 domain-containing protein [Pseudohongiella sp.]